MDTSASPSNARVNRLALVGLTALATVVGLTPPMLMLNRPQLLLYVAVGAAIVAGLYSFRLKPRVPSSPTWPEFLLGGLGAVFPAAVLGGLWMVAYGVIYGITDVVARMAGLSYQARYYADSLGFYPTLILAMLLGVAVVILSEQNLASQLYPDTAGIKSAFYWLFHQGRQRLLGCTGVALLVLVVGVGVYIALGRASGWFYLLMQLYLIGVSGSLWLEGREMNLRREVADVVEDIGRLFEAAGYQVERFPRTGNAEVDPLLVNLDLLAQTSDHCLFVDVKTADETSGPVDWKPAAGLNMATWALSKARAMEAARVDSLLVLVDVKADKSLIRFSKQEKTRVVRLSSREVERILSQEASAEQRRLAALQLLGVEAVAPQVARSAPTPDVEGGQHG